MPTAMLLLSLAAACGDDEVPPDPYVLERKEADVSPGAIYRPCETTADCVLVNVTCNGCCGVAAISATLQESFAQAKEDACEGYRGGICDCSPPALAPACVASVCTEVSTR